ncbi:YtrH family sporulation protein [Ornithinibacillus salinisoli]|uniref:YtrH family sporulation protein n=1 Tax=Ornithinibacillus salinisoli TaxID=1848459 RepID=A0ABW4W638_9BACI
MEERFFASLIHCFFIAFGVILGGTLIGSIGAFATGDAPFTEMSRLARKLRIWAVVAAIGGTFDAIENLERSLGPDGSSLDILKQGLLILSAMGGVKGAMILIGWLIQEEIT